MKMKSVSSLFCAVAIFGTASVAMAGAYGEPEQAEEMPRSAPVAAEVVPVEEFTPFVYLAVGGVFAENFFTGEVHQINKNYGWGVNARVGYRFMPQLAVELLFEDVIEFDTDSGYSDSRKNLDRKAWTLMPNLKWFPIEGFCEPYLSVGLGYMYADSGNNNFVDHSSVVNLNPPPTISHGGMDDGSAFAARFGLGADLYATENIFFEGEVAYVLPTGDAADYDYMTVSLGLGYAFN